jgi:predicted chitinase
MGAVAYKKDVTAHKKIAAELKKLQKQVKGVTVTVGQLQAVFPHTPAERIKEVVDAANKYSGEFEISTPERMAHFIGQIGAESKGLTDLKEIYSYTAQNVYDIFLKKALRADSRSSTGKTFKYCDLVEGFSCSNFVSCPSNYSGHDNCNSAIVVVYTKVNGNDECTWDYVTFTTADNAKRAYSIKTSYIGVSDLFDYTYGCRMGNGAKSTKDGSTYLGKGFIHLTGKSNYETISNEWNKLYPDDKKEFHGKDIDLLETDVEVAMKVAMIYWKTHTYKNKSANEYVDKNNIESLTRLINGGTNGKTEREKYTKSLLEEFK